MTGRGGIETVGGGEHLQGSTHLTRRAQFGGRLFGERGNRVAYLVRIAHGLTKSPRDASGLLRLGLGLQRMAGDAAQLMHGPQPNDPHPLTYPAVRRGAKIECRSYGPHR